LDLISFVPTSNAALSIRFSSSTSRFTSGTISSAMVLSSGIILFDSSRAKDHSWYYMVGKILHGRDTRAVSSEYKIESKRNTQIFEIFKLFLLPWHNIVLFRIHACATNYPN
jgi:hypothetical protein